MIFLIGSFLSISINYNDTIFWLYPDFLLDDLFIYSELLMDIVILDKYAWGGFYIPNVII